MKKNGAVAASTAASGKRKTLSPPATYEAVAIPIGLDWSDSAKSKRGYYIDALGALQADETKALRFSGDIKKVGYQIRAAAKKLGLTIEFALGNHREPYAGQATPCFYVRIKSDPLKAVLLREIGKSPRTATELTEALGKAGFGDRKIAEVRKSLESLEKSGLAHRRGDMNWAPSRAPAEL